MYQLEKLGSFFVGGRELELEGLPKVTVQRNKDLSFLLDPNGTYTIEAMYVQYFLPPQCKEVCVLVHGGGHTGAVWEGTPDGRTGWLQLLLARGIGVYIVDTVERGRSGWCSLANIWPEPPEQRTQQTIWSAFRLGKPENFEKRIPFENQQFPVNHFDTLVKYDVPRWNCNAEKAAKNLVLLLNKIGKCSMIAHSQGTDVALQACNLAPELIDKLILLEPAAFPELDLRSKQKPQLSMVYGDYLALSDFWRPIVTLAERYLEKLNGWGIDCQYLSLPQRGLKGNSHLIMMDRNNETVFKMVY